MQNILIVTTCALYRFDGMSVRQQTDKDMLMELKHSWVKTAVACGHIARHCW